MYLSLKAVNVDKKEAHIIGEISEGEYLTVNGNRFLSLFEDMEWKSVGNLMEKERIDYRKKGVPRGLGQLELPEELIDAIFDHIDNAQTAFRLGVANTRLLIIGERRIKQLLGEPSWSGDRVICIRGGDGDEEDAGDEDIDLPDGLDASDVYGDFEPAVGCRWDFVSSKNLGQCVKSYTPEFRIAEGLSTPMRVDVQHAEVAWNLTKHVYFRSDAIVMDELPEAWAYWFDGGDSSADKENMLGWTLLFYVTWTNSNIERGKWAGDRIEWTDKNVLEARLEEDGCKWTDISRRLEHRIPSGLCPLSRLILSAAHAVLRACGKHSKVQQDKSLARLKSLSMMPLAPKLLQRTCRKLNVAQKIYQWASGRD